MSQDQGASSIDLIRWTFHINSAHRAEIEGHLSDLGFDVYVQDDSIFTVTWEEPDREVDEIIEEIWALNGEAFEVTQEAFHRLEMHTLTQGEDESSQEAA
ncbi:hypothetical protein V5E97_10870 [Singulisphaera sp. Ch08]|uniref:Uncharacterized protein n=1 Tax=Singulisphaera sp. Ch08 TaxID=3120278 RepID=A0AAU7CMF8_9BACT